MGYAGEFSRPPHGDVVAGAAGSHNSLVICSTTTRWTSPNPLTPSPCCMLPAPPSVAGYRQHLKYQGPMDPKALVDYVEHHAEPIGDMDLTLQEWDKSVAAIFRIIKEDEALAQDIAQGMDDKED